MIERLLLNGINTKSGAGAIGREHHLSTDIFAHEAETAIAVPQDTCPRTEIAKNLLAVFYWVPVPSGQTNWLI